MATPPNFGGEAIEHGLDEDLRPPVTIERDARNDEPDVPDEETLRRDLHSAGTVPFGDHEAHAPGQKCALCGAVIALREEVRRRADGLWVHESCPKRA